MRRLLVISLLFLGTGCVYRTRHVREVRPDSIPAFARGPARAHLLDGSVVMLPHGFAVQNDSVFGTGTHHDALRRDSVPVRAFPLDSVAGVEAYESRVNVPATVVLSAVGTAASVLGGAVLAVAIFGSCPTFYTDSAGTWVLEAEGFSYSIAQLFEARDVDRLHAVNADSVIRLELRNEAAETHFINQIGLVVADHGHDESVYPDGDGRPVLVGPLRQASLARDRSGRDVRAALAVRDGAVVETDADRLATADGADAGDYLEFVFTGLTGDSAALVLTARNSLLTTVLLYDVMLAAQGPSAVDWLHDLQRIDHGVALGDWYHRTMGLRVSLGGPGRWRHETWLGDPGPIAWKDLAVMLPLTGDTLRVRLDFVTDGWRFDRIAAAPAARPAWREVPVARVRDRDGVERPDVRAGVAHADDRYLETQPGDYATLEFDIGPARDPRSVFLVTQGYYTEWLRPAWLRQPARPFTPSAAALGETLHRWRQQRHELHARFEATRVQVRWP